MKANEILRAAAEFNKMAYDDLDEAAMKQIGDIYVFILFWSRRTRFPVPANPLLGPGVSTFSSRIIWLKINLNLMNMYIKKRLITNTSSEDVLILIKTTTK